MTRVLLVRHGETAWNRAGRLQGWAPVPLTAHGREQARAVGAALAERYAVDAVTASDLPRAAETATLVAEPLGATPSHDERWRERDLGDLQGLTHEAIDARHPEYSLSADGAAAVEARPPGGESLADLRGRVIEAWDDLVAAAGPDETRLVVTHGGPLYLLLGHLQGRPVVESVLEHRQANGAVNEVRVADGTATVVRENETGALAAGPDGR
ncbi:MAG: histidine phosphatase family protein [Halobacteriales archaeon]